MTEPQSLAGGRYLLVKRLGEGGMATVYRAFDQRLQVWRAVKVLLPEFGRKRKLVQRFEAEAQTMALLEHPHIVRVYDVDHDGDHTYIVMELVEGGSLVDWLEQHGGMPPRMAVDVVVEICQAIEYAHEKGIIHRDIKPHNVLVDRKGTCKVTDFGIARAGDADNSLTKTGAVMGTWGYMAPEQRSDAKHVDRRADVYAIAATLYSLLTDTTPMDLFAADRDASILAGVPDVLVPLLVRATEYRREERFGSAAELAAALLAVRERLPQIPRGTAPLARDVGEALAIPPALDTALLEDGAVGGTILPEDDAPGDERLTAPRAIAGATPTSPPDLGPAERVPGREGPRWGLLVALLLGVAGAGFGVASLLGPEEQAPVAPTPLERPEAPPAAPEASVDAATSAPQEAAPSPAVAPPPSTEAAAPRSPAPAPAPAVTAPAPSPPEPTPRPATPIPAEVRPEPPATVVDPPPADPEPAVPQCFKIVEVPEEAVLGGNVAFAAQTCAEQEVTLHYRAVGSEAWYQKRLSFALGRDRGSVLADDTFALGLEWYLASGGVTYGSKARPRRLRVVP